MSRYIAPLLFAAAMFALVNGRIAGISGIVDPYGRILARTAIFQPGGTSK